MVHARLALPLGPVLIAAPYAFSRAWIDRAASGRVPFFSSALVILLTLASVGMFVALTQRIALLQISHMLAFTGNPGRQVIERMYPP
jgi:uncharacterized membrane protein